ncbi:MAG: glycosyltransferase family 4 protein [Nocardiaceae bacterium]|nr:glycosyltransferase family 4 protein [Nocardiaceae bacterium]
MSHGGVLIAHPSADVYGADLQLLESVSSFVDVGVRVSVVVPAGGPLVAQLVERGAAVSELPFPVVRRSNKSLAGLVKMLVGALYRLPCLIAIIRRERPTAVYVNTVTIPWWLVAARIARVRVVCHVHEAVPNEGLAGRLALYGPLVLASHVIVNSEATARAARATVARLHSKTTVVPNGVPYRPSEPTAPPARQQTQLGVIGRLSPNKGTIDAIEATALLRKWGYDVRLHIFGSVFEGYEWYERKLRNRASHGDLREAVVFHGYMRPVWPALDGLDIVVAPSHLEASGNTVVEAQYSRRPVVASLAEGHQESIVSGESGMLVPIGEPAGLASAIKKLIEETGLAAELAQGGWERATARNSVDAYCRAVRHLTIGGERA